MIMITNKDIRVENGTLILNGDPYPLDGQSPATIMEIVSENSDTTPTAESTNPVTSEGIKTYVDSAVAIEKVPDSFITLESGISIITSQVFKQGKHIFGWITFGFSAQTPNNLKLGVLGTGYTTNYLVRMLAGLGNEAWTAEHTGYAVKDTDNGLYITGYNNNIKSAHIHLDYVV